MSGLNQVSRRLLLAGYAPADTPPDMNAYQWFYGGWTYTSQALAGMVFETPCGLLVKGGHFTSGDMYYGGVDWQPENDNPVITCPYFPAEPCLLNHPLLQGDLHSSSEHLIFCACHQTDRPYTYQGSMEEVQDQVQAEADVRWEAFHAQHRGRVCRYQSRYNRTTKVWHTQYNPLECARLGACRYCSVLDKELDQRKGNVFFDLQTTWVEKGDWPFPDRERVSIRKGIKVLDKTVSLTICEAIARYAWHQIVDREIFRHHHEMYFDPTLRYELKNFRYARQNIRDLRQDLADAAAGIEVVHQADADRLAKEQKRARKKARETQKMRGLEKLIRTCGLSGLEPYQRQRADKFLGAERVQELNRQRIEELQQVQLSLFSQNVPCNPQ